MLTYQDYFNQHAVWQRGTLTVPSIRCLRVDVFNFALVAEGLDAFAKESHSQRHGNFSPFLPPNQSYLGVLNYKWMVSFFLLLFLSKWRLLFVCCFSALQQHLVLFFSSFFCWLSIVSTRFLETIFLFAWSRTLFGSSSDSFNLRFYQRKHDKVPYFKDEIKLTTIVPTNNRPAT